MVEVTKVDSKSSLSSNRTASDDHVKAAEFGCIFDFDNAHSTA